MKETVGGADLRRMIISAAAAIEINKQALNELNVFPVPDGDTGTNMSMTINAAASDLRKAEDPDLGTAAKIAASAMLRGARGNSGVILSLLLRGISRKLKGLEYCDGVLWAAALQEGVDAAYKAVMKPAEGTILTVARLAAAKAQDAAQENNFIEFVQAAAIEEAKAALANTVNQNPVLKKAGVVDAGGKGWVTALEAMLSSMQGEDVVLESAGEGTAVKEAADFSDFNTEDITFTYCTEFIIDRENDKDPEALRAFLSQLGDSLVLVDDDEIIKVHVHTNDPGLAIQKALKYGALSNMKIDNMRLEHQEKLFKMEETAKQQGAEEEMPHKDTGFIAVSVGDGINESFKGLGVDYIIEGGQTMNPSTEDILNAIDKVNADTIFILPNNKNIILAANQAKAMVDDKNIIVIPTKTVPQGITAVINYVPDLSAEDNEETMNGEISNVRTGQVTYAVRDTVIEDKEIRQGDYMGIGDKGILSVGADVADVTFEMIRNMMDDSLELISIYYGSDVEDADAEELKKKVEETYPSCDVELQFGGQPIYYYIVSAE